MSKYPKIIDGSGIEIDIVNKEILHFACCDCGMVHVFAFAIEKSGKLGFALRQDPRATAQLRRHSFGNLHKGVKGWQLIKMSESSGSCKCQCCGQKYNIDLIIPDKLWEQIKPAGKPPGGGLLCGRCIMNRLEKQGGNKAFTIQKID